MPDLNIGSDQVLAQAALLVEDGDRRKAMLDDIAILTGGGDVPGLNPAIRAVTVRALREGYEVVGLRRGWAGVINIVLKTNDRALAEKLRSEGHKVANNRLRWLAAVSGLEAGQDGEPDTSASGGR